jgi:hypothetical protein
VPSSRGYSSRSISAQVGFIAATRQPSLTSGSSEATLAVASFLANSMSPPSSAGIPQQFWLGQASAQLFLANTSTAAWAGAGLLKLRIQV